MSFPDQALHNSVNNAEVEGGGGWEGKTESRKPSVLCYTEKSLPKPQI